MTRRERVARAFSAAARTYEDAALAQARAAERLAHLIHAAGLPPSPRVLEIGCGTGLLTRRLLAAIPGGDWLATDIAPDMLEAARAALPDQRVLWRLMDGEHPDAAPGSRDLITSSLAAQWFGDLARALAAQAACLAPGGLLALSLPGEGSFGEWRAAHESLDLSCGVPDFLSERALATCFPTGGRLQLTRETFPVRHPDGLDFARSLRALGATLPRPGHAPLRPADFRRVLANLPRPFDVTYVIHYALWRKEW